MTTPFVFPRPRLLACSTLLTLQALLPGTIAAEAPPIFVKGSQDGPLVYGADKAGDRIVDFSYAGYGGGGIPIPDVPAKIVVEADGHHDGERIQAAIDLVAAMPADAQGFRGAVLLKPGHYMIEGNLRLNTSGVVLRGSGQGGDGTVLIAIGTSRRTLIEIGGHGRRTEIEGSKKALADTYVPVGSTTMTVTDTTGLAVGTRITVTRPSTSAWIALLGMNTATGWNPQTRIQWRSGSRDIHWDRVVTAITGTTITLDAPVTTALDPAYGGGSISRYDFPGRIDHVGVENLSCVSEHSQQPGDEEHSWCCVTFDQVENAWVRQLTAKNFVGYVVETQSDSRAITIEDCSAQDPISEVAGYRRRAFSIGGELTLVQRCQSNQGFRDFTTDFVAAGPNVFLDCIARDAEGFSGPSGSWGSGILYDNVVIRGNALRLMNRDLDDQGSGWTAANSILWNCEATDIQVQTPPGAYNQAFGCKGNVTDDKLVYDGRFMPYREYDKGMPVNPVSLYRAQLAERLGPDSASKLAKHEISLEASGARSLSSAELEHFLAAKEAVQHHAVKPLLVQNARFTIEGQPAWTSGTNWSFFQGQMPRSLAKAYGPAITRFAPGETGLGLTDDLDELTDSMAPRSAFYQHYGLWYDRQRINHNYYGAPEYRPNAGNWGPFMEQPWARSGIGHDWDGLSKYDLTRFSPWFFSRLKGFADLCDGKGLILYENVYFQHPVQETRAHYTDFPWRPVNCLQDTGLPDENPAGPTFYDLTSPVRRELHRIYIRHCLDVLKDNVNVVYGIDREYSGPLSFVQFWLDTIGQWEKENGRKVYICLEIPKAEMDAILDDPIRGPMITAIDFHDWFYRSDGSLFAIEGGINKAPREQQVGIVSDSALAALRTRMTNPIYQGGNIVNAPEFFRLTQSMRTGSAALRYRALREYRDSYPNVVLIRKSDEFPTLTATIEKTVPAEIRAATRPAPLARNHPESVWVQAAPGKDYLVYTMAGAAADLDLSHDSGRYALTWIDATGGVHPAPEAVVGGTVVTLTPPGTGESRPMAAWLVRQGN